MPEYICRGRLTLAGVVFTIRAANWEEARAKARHGQYDEYDTGPAETLDCALDTATLEESV